VQLIIASSLELPCCCKSVELETSFLQSWQWTCFPPLLADWIPGSTRVHTCLLEITHQPACWNFTKLLENCEFHTAGVISSSCWDITSGWKIVVHFLVINSDEAAVTVEEFSRAEILK